MALSKGIPAGFAPEAMPSLLDDLFPLPVAVLRKSALDHNLAWMAAFTGQWGLSHAPHGKTTMSPELFARQREHGAWAITAATAHHARHYAAWGIPRILIANQVTGRGNHAILAEILADARGIALYCLCDSVEGVRALDAAMPDLPNGNRLRVLVEVGDPGQRAGVRSVEAALDVAKACRAARRLELAGVECFEGVHGDVAATTGLFARFLAAITAIDAEDLFEGDETIVTAGGSIFFDTATRAMLQARTGRPARLVLRSGCYVTHDHGMFAAGFEAIAARGTADLPPGGLRPALEVWAHIQSRPEPTRAIASLGRRDVSYDAGMPVAIKHCRPQRDRTARAAAGLTVAKLFDQHAYLDVAADADIAVGDLVGFGISHPCTTFDKWQTMLVVDDDYRAVDTITTQFG